MVIAAAIYLSLMGAEGLRRVAARSHSNLRSLADMLSGIAGVSSRFDGACFHETVLNLPAPCKAVCETLRADGILAGYDLAGAYPELGNALLVCATETKTHADIQMYADAMARCAGAV